MIVINSPLSVEECLRRLRQKADPPWTLFGRKRLIGWVLGHRFYAYRRHPMFERRTSFSSLTVRVEPDKDGAIVYCSFRPPVMINLVFAVWAAFIFSINTSNFETRSIIIAITIFVCLIFISEIMRRLFSNDQAFLISVIRHAVDPEAGVIIYE